MMLHLEKVRKTNIQFFCFLFLTWYRQGSYGVLNSWKSLKKSWNLPREIKSRKMVKSLVFFFQSCDCFINEFFFVWFKSYSSLASYVCSVSWKKLCFVFLKVYIDHLFDKLGKINKLFWKKMWKKSGSKNLYKPCTG